VAKALAELHPEVGAAAAAVGEPAAGEAGAGAVAGAAVAASHRQQAAAAAVLPQKPCAHWEGLCPGWSFLSVGRGR